MDEKNAARAARVRNQNVEGHMQKKMQRQIFREMKRRLEEEKEYAELEQLHRSKKTRKFY